MGKLLPLHGFGPKGHHFWIRNFVLNLGDSFSKSFVVSVVIFFDFTFGL